MVVVVDVKMKREKALRFVLDEQRRRARKLTSSFSTGGGEKEY